MRADEGFNDIRMAFGGGPHEHGLILVGLFGIDSSTVFDEHLDGIDAARALGQQWAFAGGNGTVRIGACFQEEMHKSGVGVSAGLRERRHAKIVGQVRVGAGGEQQICCLHVVPVSEPKQGRGAVARADVDVDLLIAI
jgi:hypothetical protein